MILTSHHQIIFKFIQVYLLHRTGEIETCGGRRQVPAQIALSQEPFAFCTSDVASLHQSFRRDRLLAVPTSGLNMFFFTEVKRHGQLLLASQPSKTRNRLDFAPLAWATAMESGYVRIEHTARPAGVCTNHPVQQRPRNRSRHATANRTWCPLARPHSAVLLSHPDAASFPQMCTKKCQSGPTGTQQHVEASAGLWNSRQTLGQT